MEEPTNNYRKRKERKRVKERPMLKTRKKEEKQEDEKPLK